MFPLDEFKTSVRLLMVEDVPFNVFLAHFLASNKILSAVLIY